MPYAYDVTEADFDTAVLARSREVPVLVDFWALVRAVPGASSPCSRSLAADYGGRFELAKLNSDEAPSVSARYAVRSIPAVKLFVDGQVVDEFTGALPEGPVRAFLDAHLPDEAESCAARRPPSPTRWRGPSLLNQAGELSGRAAGDRARAGRRAPRRRPRRLRSGRPGLRRAPGAGEGGRS